MAKLDEGAEMKKLYDELFPGPDDHLKNVPPTAAPKDDEGRRLHELYDELFSPAKGQTNVTTEQQARVDQALGNVELSDKIGGASDAGSKPIPNEPTPMDKARDIGQDLNKSGVTMDK
jgi:hypothetical protein